MTRGSAGSEIEASKPPELRELWAAYRRSPSLEARNALLMAYDDVVHRVVGHLPATVRTYWDTEDLVSFGLFGLINAVRRWDPTSPVDRFKSYAQKCVRGAIFDELRSLDWLPRSVRQRVIAYRRTVDSLSSELGRMPDVGEVFAKLEVNAREGAELLSEVQTAQLLHLHHDVDVDEEVEETTLLDLLPSTEDDAPDKGLLAREARAEVLEAITRLPERERMVVALHFLDGLTQEQVGKLLGVSNSRICQIQASAVHTLRRLLTTPSADLKPQTG